MGSVYRYFFSMLNKGGKKMNHMKKIVDLKVE